jgi:hypothetical protein
MVVRKKKTLLSLGKEELKLPPILALQVWDNDIISPDDFLGNVDLHLNRLDVPFKSAKECSLNRPESGRVQTDLFRAKRVRGWFPCKFYDKKSKSWILGGKIDAEIELLTVEEAELLPAGEGQDEPNSNPFLPKPEYVYFPLFFYA